MQEARPTDATRGTIADLSRIDLTVLARELDAIRARVVSDLGERDARYIRRVVATQRASELAGRGLLFASLLPPAFVGGVALLSISKILENMEIGHNVIHGQYDWMKDPALNGRTYEWDWACPADAWRHTHNFVHHTFTNIVGKDRDLGYGVLRMTDDQPWHVYNLPQPIYALAQMLLFEWAVAVHELEFDRFLRGDRALADVLRALRPVLRKATPIVLKDYVLFPLLGGPIAPLVWMGNGTANLVRNVWAAAVIFCGHFPDGVCVYEDPRPEDDSRGAWYLRQILGSANIEGSTLLHIMTGHLSHQIEHHLFPDLPAHRYPQIASEVRALCERHGVPYNTGTLQTQLGGALRRVFRYALPSRGTLPEGEQRRPVIGRLRKRAGFGTKRAA